MIKSINLMLFFAISLYPGQNYSQTIDDKFDEKIVFPYGGKIESGRLILIEFNDFSNLTFSRPARFDSALFYYANFENSIFNNIVSFQSSIIEKDAIFFKATFNEYADFQYANFQNSYFNSSIFYNKADFRGAVFLYHSDFRSAEFYNRADFRDVLFRSGSNFSEVFFYQGIDLRNIKHEINNFNFSYATIFDTVFIGDINTKIGGKYVFRNARFIPGGKIEFRTDTSVVNYGNTLNYPGGRIILYGHADLELQEENIKFLELYHRLDYYTKNDIISRLKEENFKDNERAKSELDYLLARSTMYQKQSVVYEEYSRFNPVRWGRFIYNITWGLGFRPIRFFYWLPLLLLVVGLYSRFYFIKRSRKKKVEEEQDLYKKYEEVFKKLKEKDGLSETDTFKVLEEAKEIEQKKDKHDFSVNLTKHIKMQRLDLEGLDFYDNLAWTFQPHVNILLGKNGFGKSHLMQAIVSLLQKNHEKASEFFTTDRPSVINLSLKSDKDNVNIRRSQALFEESIGKIPVLAIPDSRFVNRSETTVSVDQDTKFDLKSEGAYHFLYQQPYEAMIKFLLSKFCVDGYKKTDFESGIFKLTQDVVIKLTDKGFKFSKIEPVGVNFRIEVLSEGNEDNPLPIQKASQGTLSVLAMFGLIYCYLESIFPNTPDDELTKKPAIVFIDEIDAHLHPIWQQKIIRLLRDNFPNIQFVITAHSPIVVAGCLEGEVSVLRKNLDINKFTVYQFVNDFIGWQAQEIYKKVFEIEGRDESYDYYNALYPMKDEIEAEIEKLKKKSNRNLEDEMTLRKLRDDSHYIDKAKSKQDQRLEYEELLIENDKLKKELKKSRSKKKQTGK